VTNIHTKNLRCQRTIDPPCADSTVATPIKGARTDNPAAALHEFTWDDPRNNGDTPVTINRSRLATAPTACDHRALQFRRPIPVRFLRLSKIAGFEAIFKVGCQCGTYVSARAPWPLPTEFNSVPLWTLRPLERTKVTFCETLYP
jgi:hypothetical protein